MAESWGKRDREAETINERLPEGYWVFRRFGRWDLSKGDLILRTGIKTRFEVYRLVRRHSRGRPMPCVYSAGYWRDIGDGKSEWWIRFKDFLRHPYFP